ncbi:MAG: flagellar assembly protein FliW [bacterium]|nr:flagellar assembly protein FliW [bacterium]
MTQTHLKLNVDQTVPPTVTLTPKTEKRLKEIILPLGLLGFPGPQKFSLVPVEGQKKFFRLCEETGSKLEFIIMGVDQGPDSVDPQDVRDIISQNDLIQLEEPFQVFVLISIYEEDSENGGIKVTANLKAPLIVSTTSGNGAQMILSQEKYKIRHPLTQNPISW